MVKNVFILVLISLQSFCLSGWAKEKKTKDLVSVRRGPGGYTLSIDASNNRLEEITKELKEKCGIKVTIYEKAIASLPVSVSFMELSLEEGIKRVVKAAGIKNLLITYRNGSKNKSEVAELTLLGSGGKGEGIAFTRESMKTAKVEKKKDTPQVKSKLPSQDEFSEKIESFKEKYQWEDTEARELAGHILEMMPDDAKEPGLEALTSSLDGAIAEGEEVNEEMLYQAIESTVPPHAAPIMLKSLKESVDKYKSGEEGESSRNSANKLYQDFLNKNKHGPRAKRN